VIHRDLKSPNVLINHDWEAKIADLGLAHIMLKTHISGTASITRCG
jgi:serine/threonine protein kinase